MTSTTDTLASQTGTASPEATSSPHQQAPSEPPRAALGWVAVILAGIAVVALAFATFTGSDDSSDVPAI